MTIEEIDRLKAVADQRWAAYRARVQDGEVSPSLPRFAELERQARQAYNDAMHEWYRQQEEQD